MQNKKRFTLTPLHLLFIAAEILLGVGVQLSTGELTVVFSYTSVLLAFVFALLSFRTEAAYLLTVAALGCTVVSDFFLVVLSSERLIAMIIFSAAQLCYFLKIFLDEKRPSVKKAHLIARAAAVIVLTSLAFVVLKDKADPLSIVSVFYFANLLTNIVFSFIKRESILLSAGLILFALCDVFVGLGVLGNLYMSFPDGSLIGLLADPPFNIAWLFYVPSQTLISLSCHRVAAN